MTDEMIKCDRCNLIVAKSKLEYHKESGECFLKIIGTLAGYDK